jgi:hypothetical protein
MTIENKKKVRFDMKLEGPLGHLPLHTVPHMPDILSVTIIVTPKLFCVSDYLDLSIISLPKPIDQATIDKQRFCATN